MRYKEFSFIEVWNLVSTHHRSRATELNPIEIEIHFSPRLMQAFKDLSAAVHFSEHFSPEIRMNLEDWVTKGPRSLHSALTGLPSIAEETIKHIAATGDQRAQEAWDNVDIQMREKNGFTLTAKVRAKEK